MSTDVEVITQTGRVRLVRSADNPHKYAVEAPDGDESFDKFLDAYYHYLDASGWTDKR